jgi:hypothetical protein
MTDIAALKAAAEAPYLWVYESPGHFDPQNGGEPPYTDFSDEPKPGYLPLVQANPSAILSLISRVEALERELTKIELGLFSHAKIKKIARAALSAIEKGEEA